MRRPPIPTFLTDLDREPGAVATLIAASLALLAAGLAPRIFSPGLASVQSAVRERPGIEALLMLASIVTAGMLLLGGVLGDADGRRRVMLIALGGLVATAIGGLLFNDGPLFLVGRFIDVASASIVLPIALAGVATRFQGVERATAIGLAYGAYGAATAAAPVLLTLFGPTGSRAPAFAAAAAAAIVAFAYSRRHWENLPTAGPTRRAEVIVTAVWAFGIVAITAGLIGFQGGSAEATRIGLVVLGIVLVAAGLSVERRWRRTARQTLQVHRRPVACALFVGFVIAYAQTAALFQVPIYFQLVLGYGPILSVIATIPFMVALAAAGPVAGILLARFRPRTLIVAGILAVGLGSLVIAAILRPSAGYLGFAISFALIGAGFVIATTVRTAIIFASMPRGMPATAAALNEASVALGSRAALVIVTALVTTLALDGYAASLAGQAPAAVETAVASFRTVLAAINMPTFGVLIDGISSADAAAYSVAYTEAVRTVMVSTGILTLLAAPIAWVAIGARDPLETVWQNQDEREAAPAAVSG
ncbi:MAG TPA: MFS transporter [Candidatus Limnocylindrales bacterium]